MSTLIDAPKRVLAVALAYLLVVAPVAPRAAHADEPEALTFSEYTESLASAPRADNAQTALKAREIPVDNRGAFTTSVGIDVPPGRRGMTPALAVAYSSARVRQEGPFGVGFALEVGAIRRSTAGGYPQLERVGAAAVYDDDAEGAFDGPAGRLRELECGALPGECPPESTGRVFAPEIETAPVRYEYRPDASGGAWIEYRPDGVRRYFVTRPRAAPCCARLRLWRRRVTQRRHQGLGHERTAHHQVLLTVMAKGRIPRDDFARRCACGRGTPKARPHGRHTKCTTPTSRLPAET